MDYSGLVPPAPRLRVTRQPWISSTGEMSSSAITINMNDALDEDDGSTPRRPAIDIISNEDIPFTSNAAVTSSMDTPAARLRALLSRVPNSVTPKATIPVSPPTEFDSDFDPPQSSSPHGPSPPQSAARESLKDIFSRAMRDPEDSPVKSRRRRNSASSVVGDEDVPKTWVKRTSLSDEETENLSKYREKMTPESSFRSSQAAFFDSLRARLSNSIGSGSQERPAYDVQSEAGPSGTQHTDPDSSVASPSNTPPPATSTPLRESVLQFPSAFAGSNLLSEDSGLQKLIKSVDDDSVGFDFLRDLHHPAPPERATPPATSQNAVASSSKTVKRSETSSKEYPQRHHSNEFMDSSSSRASSQQSAADYRERNYDQEREEVKAREKGWNRPQYTQTIRKGHKLNRKGSTASLTGSEDGYGSSSRRTSIIAVPSHNASLSNSRINHRRTDQASPQNIEAHRASPAPASKSPTDQRVRTMSQPTRPNGSSSQLHSSSPVTRERSSSTLSNHRSTSSLKLLHRRSSDAESSVSSLASNGSIDGSEVDQQQERERNWMSNHPVWHADSSLSHQRPMSPFTNGDHERRSHSRSPVVARQEYERPSFSMRHSTENVRGGEHSSHLITPNISRHTSDPGFQETAESQDTITSKRLSANRFGWPSSSSNSRPSLPPILSETSDHNLSQDGGQQESSSPQPPITRSRTDSMSRSHIPVRSRKSSESSVAGHESDIRLSHKSSIADLKQKVVEHLPESIQMVTSTPSLINEQVQQENGFSDQNSDMSISDSQADPVNAKPVLTLDTSNINDSTTPEGALSAPQSFLSTFHSINESTAALPSTPKRRNSFQRSLVQFQTPSPPKNMPELPGPPSSSDGEDTDQTPPVRSRNNTLENMKTPRPPGAWGTPPVPTRSQAFPPEDTSEERDGLNHDVSSSAPATLSKGQSFPINHDASLSAPPTVSRGQQLPPGTPAPPGAWMATPGTIRRKSILKVRFDDESRNGSQIENGNAQSDLVAPGVNPAEDMSNVKMDISPKEQLNGEMRASSTPPSTRALRTPRRSPTVRLVDAFGKELPWEALATKKVDDNDEESPVRTPSVSRGQKSRIRVLDAMGREVSDNNAKDNVIDSKSPLHTSQAQARPENGDLIDPKHAKALLHETITSMKEDMAFFELDAEVTSTEEQYLFKLNELSQKARVERVRIMQQMQATQSSLSKKLNIVAQQWSPKSWHLNSQNRWTFWIIMVFNILIVAMLYRLSLSRAHHLFLTSYYDPLYPDLQLHGTKLVSPRLSAGIPASRSLSFHPGDFNSFKSFMATIWNEFVYVFLSLHRTFWEIWSVSSNQIAAWPPS